MNNFEKSEKHFNLKNYYPLIILSISLITRICAAIYLSKNIVQVSDFKLAYETASSLFFNDDYHKIFTHWILYPNIIGVLFNIFGESQLVAFVFNAIICSVSAILIYYITNSISKNNNVSLVASFIYVLWPANVLYIGILTPEHITSMLLLLGVFFFFNSEEEKDFLKKSIKLFMVGVCLGLTAFFKDFGIIFIIALPFYYILKMLYQGKNRIIVSMFCITIVLIGNFIAKQFTYLYIDNLVGTKVSRNNTGFYLTEGLISTNDGQFSQKIKEEYFNEVIKNNYNYEVANENILNKLKEDIKNNDKLFELLWNKAKIVINGDTARLGFLARSAKECGNFSLAENLQGTITYINNFYFYIVIVLACIGLFRAIKYKETKLMYIYIAILGCYLLLLLIEAQNRYIYGFIPFLCILTKGTLLKCQKKLTKKSVPKCKKISNNL